MPIYGQSPLVIKSEKLQLNIVQEVNTKTLEDLEIMSLNTKDSKDCLILSISSASV